MDSLQECRQEGRWTPISSLSCRISLSFMVYFFPISFNVMPSFASSLWMTDSTARWASRSAQPVDKKIEPIS
jgi:hypothetical protein